MSATTLINVVPKLQGNNGNVLTQASNEHTLQSTQQSAENGTVLVSNLPAPSFFEQNKTLVIIIGIVIILCVVLMIFVAVYGTEAIFKRKKPQNTESLTQHRPPPLNNTQARLSQPDEAKQQQQPITKPVDVSEEMKYVNMKKQVSFADKKEEHTNVPSTKNTNNNDDENVNSNNSSDESPAHSTSHTSAPAPAPANNFYTSDDMFDISALEPPAKPQVHQPREQKDVLTQIPLYVRNSDDKDMPDIWRSKEEVSVAALVESYKTYKNPVIEKFMSTSRMSKFLNKSSV